MAATSAPSRNRFRDVVAVTGIAFVATMMLIATLADAGWCHGSRSVPSTGTSASIQGTTA